MEEKQQTSDQYGVKLIIYPQLMDHLFLREVKLKH